MATLGKPWTGFVLSMFHQKVHLCPKPLSPLSNKWAQFGKKVAFYLSYSGHKCNCRLIIVNHLDKRDKGVMYICMYVLLCLSAKHQKLI